LAIFLPTPPGLVAALDRAIVGRRPWAILFALCLVLWLPGFFTLPPSDRDESRFAQASKQMLETGDYVQIRNGQVARNQKPIGIYWLQVPFAAAARHLGLARANPIWPYRLPSLIGGLAAVLATYGFGRGLASPRAALLAAAMLAASLVLTVEVHMAKTDAALLAATTVAMGLLSRAWLSPASLGRGAALGFWAALGIAVLIKGPIAPMVCGLTTLWLTIADRKRGPPSWLWSLRPRIGLALLLAIVLPWFIAIGLATHGRFFVQSVGGDLAGKLAASDDAHAAPFGFHLVLLPLLMFAGGAAALCAVPSIWRNRRADQTRFLIAWIVPSWLVFELVATKLPHYPLPLYPAVALLAARWLLAPAEPPRFLARFTSGLTILVVILIGLAGAILPLIVQPGLGASSLLGAPLLGLAALLVGLLLRVWPDQRRATLIALVAAPLINAWLFGVELPLLSSLWIAPRVESALAARWPNGRPVDASFAALGFAEPSLMFLCGSQTHLFNSAGAAAGFLAAPDTVLLVDGRDLPALALELKQRHEVEAPFAAVTGYNYSRGKRISLILLTAAPFAGTLSADQRMK
jgi:4-amino-4-deoxy-L-arabinose transferase-like glycosyltransferase